jgi:hypothetical protein
MTKGRRIPKAKPVKPVLEAFCQTLADQAAPAVEAAIRAAINDPKINLDTEIQRKLGFKFR